MSTSRPIGGQITLLDAGGVLHLRFFGPRGTVPTLSAKRLLEDPGLAEPLRGQIVLIGSRVFGSGDTLSTPYDPTFPGWRCWPQPRRTCAAAAR